MHVPGCSFEEGSRHGGRSDAPGRLKERPSCAVMISRVGLLLLSRHSTRSMHGTDRGSQAIVCIIRRVAAALTDAGPAQLFASAQRGEGNPPAAKVAHGSHDV